MNDFLDEMWPAFEAEVGEQLDALEQLLARENGSDVDAVFRQFHTIKSSSAMMGFHGMEAVAHAAEDLLDLVRRKSRAFDEACCSTLLRAVDTLRRQLGEAIATRAAPAADEALVAALRRLVDGSAGDSGTPGTAAGGMAAAAAGAPDADTDDAAPESAWLAFSTRLVPDIAEACARQRPLPPDTALLATRAEHCGLRVIATLLQRLQDSPPGQRLPRLAALLARLRHVEKLAARPAGSEEASRRLRAALGELVGAPLAHALQVVEVTALDSPAAAPVWLAVIEPLLVATRLAGLPASERLLLLARQVLREIERETRAPLASLADPLRLAVTLTRELDPVAGEDDAYVALADLLLQNILQALRDDVADVPAARLDAAVAGVDGAIVQQLSGAQRDALASALQAGHTFVDIDADLDALPDGGAAFIDWLSAEGRLLGSHTVFAGSGDTAHTRLRFLATLPMAAADIRAALAAQDPENRVFRARFAAVGSDAAPASPRVAGDDAASRAGLSSQAPAPGSTANPAQPATASTLRVESRSLDAFVNRLGEMVMLRNMLAHTLGSSDAQHERQQLRQLIAGSQGIERNLRDKLLGLVAQLEQRHRQLQDADSRLQGTLDRLQEDVMALRVVPVGIVFNRMTRIARQVADGLGKQVRLEIHGDDVRIDKSLVDLLIDPLTHMVRNAVDHGLESPQTRAAAGKDSTGTLRLAARQQGNAILITVADDGAGLDGARILAKARALGLAGSEEYSVRDMHAFIFAPGFSTAAHVTEFSGRGVGMDVVRSRINQIGGQVDVHSEPGRGTSFTLRLPLSVAIQAVVMVQAAGRRHALPERNVGELLRVPAREVQRVRNQAAMLLRGQTLPLYRLDALLGRAATDGPATPDAATNLHVLVISDGDHRIGLVVEQVLGRQEVFVRDIHPQLMKLPGVGGAAILGDGGVVVIADIDNLMTLARRNAQSLPALLRVS